MPGRIALLYAAIATLWIIVTDRSIGAVVHDPKVLVDFSVYKGFAFVIVTAAVLYFLLRRTFRTIELAASDARRAATVAIEERGFAQVLVESLPGIFCLSDKRGRFLRWNNNFLTVSGYTAAELATMSPLEFFDGDEKRLVGARVREVFEVGEAEAEASFIAKNGTATPYHFSGRRIDFDGGPCLIGVGVDIEQRMRAERELRELNEVLERRVESRTRELEVALHRAESADRLKSSFLATMSHELRTPLNSIIGFTGILLQGLAGPLNPEQKNQLGMVQSSGRHLLDLINDVLDISKIEAGQLRVSAEPFDLLESVERVVASVSPQAARKGLTMSIVAPDALPPLHSDRRRVEQILLNLINNAIKFTEQGSVTVRVEAADGAGKSTDGGATDVATIRVEDTGIGMKPECLPSLFQPFHQIDTGLQRQHEGTGLGLAICSRLVHLLGGDISVESVYGEGSVFTVQLRQVGVTS